MVFQIRWTEDYTKGHYALFDVEIWETKGVTNKWYTELRAHSLVEGITRYLMAQNDNVNFNVEEFIKDAYEIEELRGWIWEVAFYTIKENNTQDAHKQKCDYVRNKMKAFCEKYGCYLNED